jgi:hypothetical protein
MSGGKKRRPQSDS